MAERVDSRTWVLRGVFVLIAFTLVVIDLVPLDLRPRAWAGPDLLLVFTLVWVVRRPALLPVTMVAAIMLMADFLFMRPPGLWAVLVVLLTEFIRQRNSEFRNMPFPVEWGTVAGGILFITLVNQAVLFILASPRPHFGLSLIEALATILAYPVVVALAYFVFRIRRAAPGETGSKGQLL